MLEPFRPSFPRAGAVPNVVLHQAKIFELPSISQKSVPTQKLGSRMDAPIFRFQPSVSNDVRTEFRPAKNEFRPAKNEFQYGKYEFQYAKIDLRPPHPPLQC